VGTLLVFYIIDCHICQYIFGKIDIIYCRLLYISENVLHLKTLILYIYRSRVTPHQWLYLIYSSICAFLERSNPIGCMQAAPSEPQCMQAELAFSPAPFAPVVQNNPSRDCKQAEPIVNCIHRFPHLSVRSTGGINPAWSQGIFSPKDGERSKRKAA
jgi:hypothetical protein